MAWSISSDNVNVNVVDYLSGKNVQTFIIDAAVKVLSVLFDHHITFDLNGKLCCFCIWENPAQLVHIVVFMNGTRCTPLICENERYAAVNNVQLLYQSFLRAIHIADDA